MAFLQQAFLFATALIVSSTPYTMGAATYAPPSLLYGTSQQICNYQYAVPHGTGCLPAGTAVEQRLNDFQHEIDRLNLQYVSQNTILQEQISKLNRQASATDASVVDLTKEFRNLQNTVGTLQNVVNSLATSGSQNGGGGPNSGGPGIAILQQMLTTMRAQLQADMLMLENEISSVKTAHQQDSIQQSKLDSALQAQLRQQEQDAAVLRQQIRNLDNIVNGLSQRTYPPPQTYPPTQTASTAATTTTKQSPTTAQTAAGATNPPSTTVQSSTTTTSQITGSTTLSPTLLQLQQLVKGLDGRMQTLEQNFQTDVADLKKNMSDLQALGSQQALNVSNVATELDYLVMTEIPEVKTLVQNNRGAIMALNQFRSTTFQALETQVQKVAQNVTGLLNQITGIGTATLNQMTQVKDNARGINDLQMQVHLLAGRLTRLQSATNVTLPPPPTSPTTQPPPSTTKFFPNVPTPKHNG